MVEKILNDTTPYGKIRASHEGSLHSSTLRPIDLIEKFKLTMQILRYSFTCETIILSFQIFSRLS